MPSIMTFLAWSTVPLKVYLPSVTTALSSGVSVYAAGDTSETKQMAKLAEKGIDYALFCCDGVYNMDLAEAARCASLVGAKCNIPYHMAPGKLFDKARAEQFDAPGRLIVADGEEIELSKQ